MERHFSGVRSSGVRHGAEAPVEFAGVFGAGQQVKLALTNRSNAVTRWVAVGEEFAGFIVKSYDQPNETVVLTKDGAETRVKLKSARVKTGAVEPTPQIKQAIMRNLRQLSAAADQFYLENGVARTTFDQLVGIDAKKYVKSIEVVAGENYRTIEFALGKPLLVTTADGFKVEYLP